MATTTIFMPQQAGPMGEALVSLAKGEDDGIVLSSTLSENRSVVPREKIIQAIQSLFRDTVFKFAGMYSIFCSEETPETFLLRVHELGDPETEKKLAKEKASVFAFVVEVFFGGFQQNGRDFLIFGHGIDKALLFKNRLQNCVVIDSVSRTKAEIRKFQYVPPRSRPLSSYLEQKNSE